jgi:hypothetical protein
MFVGGGRGDNLRTIMYDLNEKFEKTISTVSLSLGKLSESCKSAAVKKQINCFQSANGFIKPKMSPWLSKFVICSLGEAGGIAWGP